MLVGWQYSQRRVPSFFFHGRKRNRERKREKTTTVGKENHRRHATGPSEARWSRLGPRRDPERRRTTSIEIRFRRRDSIVRTSPVDPTWDKGKRPIPGGCCKNRPTRYGGTLDKPSFFLSFLSPFILFLAPTLTKREGWSSVLGEIYCCFR